MAFFRYKARDRLGGLLVGSVESSDIKLVHQNLKKLGYNVVNISSPGELELFIERVIESFKRINQEEVAIFTRQLAAMLKSGLPLIASLEAVKEQAVNKKFRIILGEIIAAVQRGNSFSESITKYPKVFSGTYVSMIHAAESGGMFVEILERLANLGMQEMDLRGRVKSAFIYPILLVCVAFVIVIFFLIKVLPRFNVLFEASGARLPIPTLILIGTSNILKNFWYLILIFIGVLVYYFKKYLKTESGLYNYHRMLLKLPIFGPLILKVTITRFARTLSALLKSGVSILEGLGVVENTIPNIVVKRVIQNIQSSISEGQSLVEPFKASGLFPPLVIQMLSAGEKSGHLENMLNDIADFYDLEINYTVRNLSSLLEPILLLVMGGLVGFIALSVLLPIFNLVRVFKQ